MVVLFYQVNDAFGCFSNFSPHGFHLYGRHYRTGEHFYQSQKFAGTPYENLVIDAETPREAADLGRRAEAPVRADWAEVKDDIMKQGLLAKFEAHGELAEILLATGEEEIVENSPTDAYWGTGPNGDGRNRLGRLLMEIRDGLRRKAGAP